LKPDTGEEAAGRIAIPGLRMRPHQRNDLHIEAERGWLPEQELLQEPVRPTEARPYPV
jgi:hypothetical protein